MHPTTPLLPLLLLVTQTTATLAPASSNTKAKYPSSPACSGTTFPVSPHVRTHLTPHQSPKPRAPSKPPSAATTHASPRKPLPSSQPTTSTTRSPVPRTARARPTRVRPGARWSRPRTSGRFSGMALASRARTRGMERVASRVPMMASVGVRGVMGFLCLAERTVCEVSE
jgi:hypothetical protein